MLILLLLILWPIAELFVAIKVAEAIGVLATILLLIASWPLGTWALRSQGRLAWRRLTDAIAGGTRSGPPIREVLNSAFVLVGGVLLIVPGFITDVLGLIMLLPPTRALLRAPLQRNLHRRWLVQAVRFTRRPMPYDVDSTATEVDPPQLRS